MRVTGIRWVNQLDSKELGRPFPSTVLSEARAAYGGERMTHDLYGAAQDADLQGI